MLKRIKQNLVKDKEISILIFLYFLILNFWYNEISNYNVFDKLLKFEDENFYFIPYLTSVIFNSLMMLFGFVPDASAIYLIAPL